MQLLAGSLILLQDHSTCFGCCPHLPSGVHKTVTTASGTGHIIVAATYLQRGQVNLAIVGGRQQQQYVTCTGGCSYSFMYS